jgi:hypothetical protein
VTPDLLRELSAMRLFPQTARELMRVVGLSLAAHLIAHWGGRTFPVPLRTRRNERGERRFEQLAQIVGEIPAGRIVAHWGGQRLDIPNCKEVLTERQHGQIRRDYDWLTGSGYTHPEAVWEIGLNISCTDRAIERVLGQPSAYEFRPIRQGVLF